MFSLFILAASLGYAECYLILIFEKVLYVLLRSPNFIKHSNVEVYVDEVQQSSFSSFCKTAKHETNVLSFNE